METSIKTNEESKGFYKLSWLQRIGFGSGDLAQNLTGHAYMDFFQPAGIGRKVRSTPASLARRS